MAQYIPTSLVSSCPENRGLLSPARLLSRYLVQASYIGWDVVEQPVREAIFHRRVWIMQDQDERFGFFRCVVP